MNKSNAAQIRSCHKTGHIAHNAAADGNNQRLPIGSGAAKGSGNLLDAPQMFRRLCIVEKVESISVGKPQAALQGFPDSAPYFWRRNNVNTGKISEGRNFACRVTNGSRSSNDGIGTGRRLHSNARDFHLRDVSQCSTRPFGAACSPFSYPLVFFVLPYLSDLSATSALP